MAEQKETPEQLRARRQEHIKTYGLKPDEYFVAIKEFARGPVAGGFVYSVGRVARIIIGDSSAVIGTDGQFYGAKRELLPDQSWWGIRLDEANKDLREKTLQEIVEKPAGGVRFSS